MSEDLKSSALAWGGREENITDNPPAYGLAAPEEETNTESHNANTTVAAQPRRPRTTYDPVKRLTALSTIGWQKYNIADGTLSSDQVTVTVKHSDMYSQPQHLHAFILEQAFLPPKPMLRIAGSTYSYGFNITMNLTHLLNLKSYKWNFSSAQVSPIHDGPQTLCDRSDPAVKTLLASTVKKFCKDHSENKSYTFTRKIDGLPTEVLAGYIRNLAASIKYCGRLKIDFIDERSRVVVHKQPSSWFSTLLRLHPEKKFDMVETVWDLSDPFNSSDDTSSADAGLRTAREWWQSWSDTIRNAMIAKHKGNLGLDDWIETKMGRHEDEPRVEWGRDHEV